MSTKIDDLLQEVNELPDPKRSLLTKNEALLIDFCHRLAEPLRNHGDALEVLREVSEWIGNWDPNFTQDDEWPATAKKMADVLAKAEG